MNTIQTPIALRENRNGQGEPHPHRRRLGAQVTETCPFPHDGHSDGSAVAARIQDKLDSSAYPSLRQVHCVCQEGKLVLQGDVPNYYCVQVAISLVRAAMSGNVLIRNCLRVVNK